MSARVRACERASASRRVNQPTGQRVTGFTLIELLIVVAIIAILAAIAVPNFLEAQTRAKVSRSKADIRSVVTALESYYVDWNNYPPNLPMIANFRFNENYFAVTTPVAYMTSIPNDPFRTGNPTYPGHPEKSAQGRTAFEFYRYGSMAQIPPNFPGAEAYSLRSLGPDRDLDLVGSTGVDGDNDEAVTILNGIYDPTNGTVSDGDIIRFGGAVATIPGSMDVPLP